MTDQISALQEQLDKGNASAFDKLASQYCQLNDWRSVIDLYQTHYSSLKDGVDWSEMVQRLEDIAQKIPNAKEKGEALVAVGDFYVHVVGNRDAGMKAYQASFKTFPHDTTCLENARAAYLRDQEYERILTLFQLELKFTTEASSKSRLMVRMAQILGDGLRDFDGAIAQLDEAHAIAPLEGLTKQLREVYGSRNTIQDTITGLIQKADEQMLKGTNKKKPCEHFIQAANWERFRDAGDDAKALEIVERALQLSPKNKEAKALFVELSKKLGGAVQLQAETEQITPDTISDTVPVIKKVNNEPSDSEHEKDFYGDLEAAREVLAHDPLHLEALQEVRKLLREREDWDALLEQLEQSVRFLRKKQGELEVMAELASLLWKQFGDFERAEHYYKRIKLLDNSHPDIVLFYKDYYIHHEEWRKLFALLSTHQQTLESGAEKREITEEMADLAVSRLKSSEKAMEVWRGYLRNTPDDEVARSALSQLYEKHGKTKEHFELLKEEVAILEQQGEKSLSRRVEIHETMVALSTGYAGLEVARLDALKALLQLQPLHSNAVDQLREFYAQEAQWEDLASLLLETAKVARDQDQEALYLECVDAGTRILLEHLKSPNRAKGPLESALEVVPEHAEFIRRLVDVYATQGEYHALFQLKKQMLSRCSDADELEALLRELRALAQDTLQEPELAIPILEQLRKLYPEDISITRQLISNHRALQNWELLAIGLEELARIELDVASMVELLSEAAEVCEHRLGRPDRAADLWQRVLELDLQNIAAFGRLTVLYLDAGQYESLEQLYRRHQKFEELYDLFDAAAGSEEDSNIRQVLYRKMAELAEHDIKDADRVIISLEDLLEISVENSDVMRELIRWYGEVADRGREIEMSVALLEQPLDNSERQRIMARLAELEQARGNFVEAFERKLQELSLGNPERAVLQHAKELATQAGKVDEYIEHIQALFQRNEDESVRDHLAEHAGFLLWQELKQFEDAVPFFERLHVNHPQNEHYLQALIALCEELEHPQQRLEYLQKYSELLFDNPEDKEKVLNCLVQMGALAHHELGEVELSRQHYARALELDASCLQAIRGQKALFLELHNWDEARESMMQELAYVTSDRERSDVHMELARLLQEHCEEWESAVEHLKQVLSMSPSHESAIEALETMLVVPSVAKDVSFVLEPIFRQQNRADKLAAVLEARLEVTEQCFEKEVVLEQLVELYLEELDNPTLAFQRCGDWFELAPGQLEIRDRLFAIAESLKAWQELDRLLTEHSALNAIEVEHPLDMLRKIATVREHHLHDERGTTEAWECLYKYCPDDLAIIDKLASLYRVRSLHAELIDLLTVKASLIEDQKEQAVIMADAASVADNVLQNGGLAIECYEKSLQYFPGHEASALELEKLLIADMRWQDLEELYVGQASIAHDTAKGREWIAKHAAIKLDHLNDWDGVLQLLHADLAEDPYWEEALQLLERLDAQLESSDAMHRLRFDVAQSLEPVYRIRAEYSKLVKTLITLSELERNVDSRAELLDEAALISYEQLQQKDEAFDLLCRAALFAAHEPSRRQLLEQWGVELQRVEDLLDCFRCASETHEDRLTRAVLLKRIGHLERTHSSRVEKSIEAFESAKQLDPTDTESLLALEGLFEAIQDYERLAGNLREQLQYADPDVYAEILRRLAELQEVHLQAHQEAIASYEELLGMDACDFGAIEALERLYQSTQQWHELCGLLHKKSDVIFDSDARIGVLHRLATVFEEELSQPEDSILVYESILAIDSMDAKSLLSLSRLNRQLRRWVELADVLRNTLLTPLAETESQRNDIELELAQVLDQEIFSTDEAIIIYRAVLNRTPNESRAVRALENLANDPVWLPAVARDLIAVYEGKSAWQELVSLYEKLCKSAIDPDSQANWLAHIARINRRHLGDPGAAIGALASAWRLCPEQTKFHDELLAVVAEIQAWEHLALVYEDILQVVDDTDQRNDLCMLLGDVYYHQLDQDIKAEERYREVIAQTPTHAGAFLALEHLLSQSARWQDLIELYRQKASHLGADNTNDHVGILLKIAQVYDEHLCDRDSAIDAYQRLLQVRPYDNSACVALNQLFRDEGRWDELAQLLETQLDQPDLQSAQKIAVCVELAEIYHTRIHDNHRALELYESVLESDIDNKNAIESVESILELRGVECESAALLLEPIYRRRHNWKELLDVLDILAQSDVSSNQKEEYLQQIARISEFELDDLDRARKSYGMLLRLRPSQESVRLSLHRLCAQTDQWSWLAETFEAVLEGNNQPVSDEERVVLLVELARVYEERLENLEVSLKYYREALTYDASNNLVSDAIERLLLRQRDWPELAQFFETQLLDIEQPREKRSLLERLGVLYEEFLKDIDAAIDVHSRILDDEPSSHSSQSTLERLFAHGQRWRELADYYAHRALSCEDPEHGMDFRVRQAQVLERELNEIDAALDIYFEILSQYPGHFDVLRALEGMRHDLARREDRAPARSLRIIEVLVNHYEERTAWRRIAELLREQLEFLEDRSAKADVLIELSGLLLRTSDDSFEHLHALQSIVHAFCLCPEVSEIREKLDILAAEQGAWQHVIRGVLGFLEQEDDLERQVVLLEYLAELFLQRVSDKEAAALMYQQISELQPDSDRPLAELYALYQDMELLEGAAAVLEQRLTVVYEESMRAEILQQCARIYVTLQEDEKAIEKYESLMQTVEEVSIEEAETLAALYEKLHRFDSLERLLFTMLDFNAVDQTADLWKRLGSIQESHLHKFHEAIGSYTHALKLDDNDIDTVKALGRLYEKTEQWPNLVDILVLEKDFAAELSELNAVEYRIGKVFLDQLNAFEDAFAAFRNILLRTPSEPQARNAMHALLDKPETFRDVASLLTQLHTEHEEWDALEALYRRQLDILQNDDSRADVFRELASFYEKRRGNPLLAFVTWGRAFREFPDKTYIRYEMELLAESLENHDELAAIYEDGLHDLSYTTTTERELRWKLAEIYANNLSENQKAIEHLECILRDYPDDIEVLETLDKLYQVEQQWEQLASILQRKLTVVAPDELVSVRYRLAYLYEVKFEEYREALDLYRAVVMDDGSHQGAIQGFERLLEHAEFQEEIFEILEPIYVAASHHAKLLQLYHAWRDLVEGAQRRELSEKAAEIALNTLDNVKAGFRYLASILLEDPEDVEVEERLVELAFRRQLITDLVDLFEQVVESHSEPSRVIALASRAAQWAIDDLDDIGRAHGFLAKVLSLEQDNRFALDMLELIARKQGDLAALAQVLQVKVEVIEDNESRIQALVELAQARVELEQHNDAIAAYRQALIIDPQNTRIIQKLLELLETHEHYHELVDLMEHLSELVQKDDNKLQMLIRIGRYCTIFLKDSARALETYQRALFIDEHNEVVIESLEELYRQSEDWSALVELLQKRLDISETDELRRELHMQRAILFHQSLCRVDEAIEEYRLAFDLVGNDCAQALSIFDELSQLYRDEGRWSDFMDLSEKCLELLPDEDSTHRLQIWQRIAELCDNELNDPDRALKYWREIAAVDPNNLGALNRLVADYEQASEWNKVLEVFETMLTREGIDNSDAINVLLKRAQLYLTQLNDQQGASQDLERILALQPRHAQALELLSDLLRENQQYMQLYELLNDQLKHASNDEQVQIYGKLAELALCELKRPDLHLDALQQAYELDRENVGVAERLVQLYIESEQVESAQGVLSEIVAILTQQRRLKETVKFHHLRGQLAEQSELSEEAEAAYETAHRIDATFLPNLLSYGKLMVKKERWKQALKLFQTLLLHQMNIHDNKQKLELYFYLGQVRVALGDSRRARDMFQRALSIDPEHAPSIQAMARLE